LTIAGPGIHSVEFLGTRDDAGVALDDFIFDTVTGPGEGPFAAVTPLPSTLPLRATGLGAFRSARLAQEAEEHCCQQAIVILDRGPGQPAV
jgi:hypothetical protein